MNSVLFSHAALLDPATDELLEDHHVLVEDGLVKEVSDRPLTSSHARVIDLGGRTLMPGLIDLHVHVLGTQLDLAAQVALPDALVMMRAVPILAAMLRRGFTTVRDAGGAGFGLKCAVAQGVIPGPRLFVSGHALSQTGGHGDTRARADFLRPVAACGCFRAGALSAGRRRRRCRAQGRARRTPDGRRPDQDHGLGWHRLAHRPDRGLGIRR